MEKKPFMIRIDDSLKNKLGEVAKKQGRSINNLVNVILFDWKTEQISKHSKKKP